VQRTVPVHGQIPEAHDALDELLARAHDVLERSEALRAENVVNRGVALRRGQDLLRELVVQRAQPVLTAPPRAHDERAQRLGRKHGLDAREAHARVDRDDLDAEQPCRVRDDELLHLARHPRAYLVALLQAQPLEHAHREAVRLPVELAHGEAQVLRRRDHVVARRELRLADVLVVKGGDRAR
jgi:hypothetical protein